MRAQETISRLAAFERRGPGSDAERRAALWLSRELAESGREVQLEPFWCRPNWALAHAWHAALALAGSLLSVNSPRTGGVLLLIALISVIADELTGFSLGRRLTPERASQNVVSPGPRSLPPDNRVHVILTANIDAGRTGTAYRDALRVGFARLRQASGGAVPGWLGWFAIAIIWLLAIALLRLEGSKGAVVSALQLIPTVGLVLALALLLDVASADFAPAANDNGSGIGVALALVRALDVAPPRHIALDVVLAGAGEGRGIGLRRHLRARKGTVTQANTVVIGIAACGAGHPRWWVSDGALVALRYFKALREICANIAGEETQLAAAPHRGRGAGPALPARARSLPAITIGCLDERGLAPRSHRPTDVPAAIDPAALDDALQFGLMLVDGIDAFVAGRGRGAVTTPA